MFLKLHLLLKSSKLEVCGLSYGQNKSTGFREIWTALPLKYLHVSLHIFGPYHRTIPTQTKTRSKPTSNLTQTNKTKIRGELGFFFLTWIVLKTSNIAFLLFLSSFSSFPSFPPLYVNKESSKRERENQKMGSSPNSPTEC